METGIRSESEPKETHCLVVGPRLKILRRERGWSQRDLARASGLSLACVFNVERGRSGLLRDSTLARLARALGVSVGELTGRFPIRLDTPEECRAYLAFHSVSDWESESESGDKRPDLADFHPEQSGRRLYPDELPARADVEVYHRLFPGLTSVAIGQVAAREDFPAGAPIDPAAVLWSEAYQGWLHAPGSGPVRPRPEPDKGKPLKVMTSDSIDS